MKISIGPMARSTWLGLVLVALHPFPSLAAEARSANPISRVARLINPSLVEIEHRLGWLEHRLRGLATFSPKPLNDAVGWRAVRADGDPPPCLTLDLGDIYPLEDLFLIPARTTSVENRTLFPLRFRIETALLPDFSDARVIYETPARQHEEQDAYPLRVVARDTDARYVRLHILLGHHQGLQSLATLSELVVISGGQPVSFGATATASGSLDEPGLWDPAFVIDGRSPLGIWEGGKWTNSRGHVVAVEPDRPVTEWRVDLGRTVPVDRVVLFPLRMPEIGGVHALPRHLSVSLSDDPTAFERIEEWSHRGGEIHTPVIFAGGRPSARYVTIRADGAVNAGIRHFQPLAELEVWSHARNLAPEATIEIIRQGASAEPATNLADGYANGLRVFPVAIWLRQLTERQKLENELNRVAPMRHSMATETELNTAWGASVAIGLTLLIPIAIVERRRLVSRKQMDHLRRRIASDLHDDIGSNLGSISLIARSAKKDLTRLHGPEALADDLEEMEIIARESSLAMRDIVWLLERRRDTIGDFVQRMRDCAQRLLRDLDYELVCRSNRTAAKMTLDAKRHLFLFYKEALHNILKHSRADRVTIHIRDRKDCLVMEITDNGVGLPVDEDGRPIIVRKLADRATVLEGRLEVKSSRGRGTSLRFEVKRSTLTSTKPSE